jgi:hypothetical protein
MALDLKIPLVEGPNYEFVLLNGLPVPRGSLHTGSQLFPVSRKRKFMKYIE